MSTSRHNVADRAVDQAAHFAHELANLLDGSMRNVALVRSLMGGAGADNAAADDETALLARLQTAEEGMRKMATLIRNWMAQNHHPAALHEGRETLGESIFLARQLHEAAATALGITIDLHVSGEAAALPAGPVFPVLANALRNSIEAIAAQGDQRQGAAVIEVRARVQGGQVRLTIADNGPGLSRDVIDTAGIFCFGATSKPDGHGLGLTLSRDIAGGLGGHLRVANREEGGVQVTLSYPAPAGASAQQPR